MEEIFLSAHTGNSDILEYKNNELFAYVCSPIIAEKMPFVVGEKTG